MYVQLWQGTQTKNEEINKSSKSFYLVWRGPAGRQSRRLRLCPSCWLPGELCKPRWLYIPSTEGQGACGRKAGHPEGPAGWWVCLGVGVHRRHSGTACHRGLYAPEQLTDSFSYCVTPVMASQRCTASCSPVLEGSRAASVGLKTLTRSE